jgi:hypothetical protein
VPEYITKLAVVKYPWNKTGDTPNFTGIPPHVVQLSELEKLERKVACLKDDILGGMRDEMDRRGFKSTECNTNDIIAAMTAMSERIVKDLLEKTELVKKAASSAVDESTPQHDGTGLGLGLVLENEDDGWCDAQLAVTENDEGITEEERQLERTIVRKRVREQISDRHLKAGYHHKSMNPLPSNFKFCPMTSLQLIQCWFIGDAKRNIPPLFALNSDNVKFFGGNKVRNKMVPFMGVVMKEAKAKDAWLIAGESDLNYASVNRMWDAIEDDFKAKYMNKKNTKRAKELSWHTVYQKMSDANAFDNDRNKANADT